jgi:hypothetical protein
MHLPKDEMVPCYHCGRAIYFTAAECSHCGSREPGGPDVFSRKEIRQRVIEARHDHTLAITTLACGVGGILYGSLKSGILVALAYGLFGLAAGVLVGLAIVITTWVIASELLLSERDKIIAGTLLSADHPIRRIISGSELFRWIEEEEK